MFSASSSRSTGIYKSNSLLFGFTVLRFPSVSFSSCAEMGQCLILHDALFQFKVFENTFAFPCPNSLKSFKTSPQKEIIQNHGLQLHGFVLIFLFVCLFELGNRDITINFQVMKLEAQTSLNSEFTT